MVRLWEILFHGGKNFVPFTLLLFLCASSLSSCRFTWPGTTRHVESVASRFPMLSPGSPLPTDRECASRIQRSLIEVRQDNDAANHRVPVASQLAHIRSWNPMIGMNSNSDRFRKQVTGNFTGTTDEILQWVACKWGFDRDIVRAQANVESTWYQKMLGDVTTDQKLCPPGTWDGSRCYQSYGILQMKYIDWPGAWPMSRDNTAFNADFAYAWMRSCFEGWVDYLHERTSAYHAGDIWGCVGFWYSGGWYDSGAVNYINQVKSSYYQKPWLDPSF